MGRIVNAGSFREMYLKDLVIGNHKTGNFTLLDGENGVKLFGSHTCWDDLVGNLTAYRLESIVGKINYNWAENTITFNSGGAIATSADRIMSNLQYPHGAKEDGSVYFHIHWEQPDDQAYVFTLQYRTQSNNAEKETDWTTITATAGTDDVFTYPGSGTFNQITAFAPIDMTDAGISATLQYRLARTDTKTGDIEVSFLDAHIEFDMFGSKEEFVK